MGGFILQASFLICLFLDASTTVEDLAVISHPENATAHIGQTVRMRCEFNRVVNCTWLRHGGPVTIAERYAYVDQPQCTFNISNVEDIDFGEWKCGAVENENYVFSNSAVLTRKEILDVYVQSKDEDNFVVKIELDNNRVLICHSQNKAAADYIWEYKDNDSNEWLLYASTRIVHFPNSTISQFRCLAVVSGQKIYSNEYMITFVTEEKVDEVHISFIGFLALGFFVGAIGIFGVVYFCNRNSISGVFFKKLRPKARGNINNKTNEQIGLLEAVSSPIAQTNDYYLEEFKKRVDKNQTIYKREKDKMTTVFTWTINNYSELKKQHERATMFVEFIESDAFDVKGTDLKMTIKLYLFGYIKDYGSFITPVLEFVKNGTDRVSAPLFLHKRIIKLLDQREIPESEKHHIYFDYEVPFGSDMAEKWMNESWKVHMFARHVLVESENSPFLKNDTIKLQLVIEPLALLWNNVTCYNGILEWTIPEYSLKKQKEREGFYLCLRSDHFYTGPYGYRCKVTLFLNGNGKGHQHHMSIYLGFLKGEWDDRLDKVFAYTVRYAIINPNKPDKHIERVDIVDPKFMGQEEGSLRVSTFTGIEKFAFIEDDYLEKNGFLVDDQIIVRVSVEISDSKYSAVQGSVEKSLTESSQVLLIE